MANEKLSAMSTNNDPDATTRFYTVKGTTHGYSLLSDLDILSDHGEMSGLTDDDHTQYILIHIEESSDPTTDDDIDDGYRKGTIWVNETDDDTFLCTDSTVGAAIWKKITNLTYTNITANDSSTDITAAELEELTDGSETTLHTHAGVDSDKLVGIDATATPSYLGAASNDGVLRVTTTNGLTYSDGGDFVTIAFDADYDDISGNDSATDVTGSELETLTDGSNADSLHIHGAASVMYQIDQSGGTSDTYGVLSGLLNGSNKLYTVSAGNYTSGKLMVYLNGQLQIQGSSEDWVETTPGSGTFTFAIAPESTDNITVSYYYSGGMAGE